MHGLSLYIIRESCLATGLPIELDVTVIALTLQPLETATQYPHRTWSLANGLF